jgi:hypothetical protein
VEPRTARCSIKGLMWRPWLANGPVQPPASRRTQTFVPHPAPRQGASTSFCPTARYQAAPTKATYADHVVVFAGIRLASLLVKTGQDGQRPDYFRADKAWWYITLLTIGYMIARGLAKSGSREPYDDDRR